MNNYTIAQLLPTVIRELAIEEGKYYTVSDPQLIEIGGGKEENEEEQKMYAYVLFVSDPKSGKQCPVTWTFKDEEQAAEDNEVKERLISDMAENAVDSLTHLIEYEDTKTFV